MKLSQNTGCGEIYKAIIILQRNGVKAKLILIMLATRILSQLVIVISPGLNAALIKLIDVL